MKQNFIAYSFCIYLFSTAAYSQQVKPLVEHQQSLSNPSLSAQDQRIIKKYKEKIERLDLTDPEKLKISIQQSLGEIHQIQNKKEREKIQMNIYLGTEMYQEAFELNNKQLQEGYSESKLFMHCELMQILEFPLIDVQKCQSKIAVKLKHELESTSKEDPNYDYLQWGYLLSMYKSGHLEYKKEMEKFIQSIEDETMKFQFQSSYELALEQRSALLNKQ